MGSFSVGWLVWVAIVSIVGIIIVLVNTKHHQGVGVALVVIGILGNLLLIIPGIMAYRYKPKSEWQIKPQNKQEGQHLEHIDPEGQEQKYQEELKEVRAKLEADEKRLAELERKKEDKEK